MIRRLLAALAVLLCLGGAAMAEEASGRGRNAHLVPQTGEYDPRYSVSTTFEVLPGAAFELIVYEDSGTQPLLAARNGGGAPAGVSLQTRVREGKRQACIAGTVYARGEYVFSLLVQEETGGSGPARTLAILHVRLRITDDAPQIEPYARDGQGMLVMLEDGVNFRRTPGGTRLGQYDTGERLVWCSTQEKGGYTWYRVWSEDFGYGYVRGDLVQVEARRRIVYTPGREMACVLFITPGSEETLTPELTALQAPEAARFESDALVASLRDGDVWTLLRFCFDGEMSFWIRVEVLNEHGAPRECQYIYLTNFWQDLSDFTGS